MSHSVILTWAAPSDAISTTTYNVYRSPNACPTSGLGGLTFTKLNTSGIVPLTYTDTNVTVGNYYCYYATQVQGSIESAPGTLKGGPVLPNTVTIQLVIN